MKYNAKTNFCLLFFNVGMFIGNLYFVTKSRLKYSRVKDHSITCKSRCSEVTRIIINGIVSDKLN